MCSTVSDISLTDLDWEVATNLTDMSRRSSCSSAASGTGTPVPPLLFLLNPLPVPTLPSQVH